MDLKRGLGLAIDNFTKEHSVSAYLLIESLKRIVEASLSVGGIGYASDATDDGTKLFYENLGSSPLTIIMVIR